MDQEQLSDSFNRSENDALEIHTERGNIEFKSIVSAILCVAYAILIGCSMIADKD